MTVNIATETNGKLPSPKESVAIRDNKQSKNKTVSRRPAVRAAGSNASSGGYTEAASKLMSRGKNAAQGAYEWAADNAGRALPLAARHMPDQRSVRKLVDERPYLLGAIGLGIGVMIGLMLPAQLVGGATPPSPRTARRAGGKR